ncbi:MAG: hypothetical protein JW946_01750 [Candidatus Omnitrophica bacterium]|nr:hypothetical protein [Candidatus Omnitrophota bacterium]
MDSIGKSAIIRVCIIIACLVFILSGYCYAEGNASVNVVNLAGVGNFTITVRNKDGSVSPDGAIQWTGNSAEVGAWRVADQYLEISYSDLPESWGIQIYTDNKNSNPAFAGAGNPAGLVRLDNASIAIPLAWRVSDKAPSEYTSGDTASPYHPDNVIERNDYKGMTNYLWHFIKDKNTPDDPETPENETFVNGAEDVTIWSQKGIAWNEGAKATNPRKAYVYLAARLTTISVGVQAKTTTLTAEAFHGISPFPMYIYKNAFKYGTSPNFQYTLENHYAPAGWMNYNGNNIQLDDQCATTPHSEEHCFKYVWNGTGTQTGGKWSGIAWLEPGLDSGNNWIIDDRGYDLRGVTHLSFFAKTNLNNAKMKYYMGHPNDSCGQFPVLIASLTTEWQPCILPIKILKPTADMSHVSVGLAVTLGEDGYPAGVTSGGYTVYLDDIRFLGIEPLLNEYTFVSNPENWTYVTYPDIQAALGSYDSARQSLKIAGPGGALDPRGCAGSWNSPQISDIRKEKLYKMTFDTGTDASNRNVVPEFRFRIHSLNTQVNTTTTVFSQGDASACPKSGDDKRYEVYFTTPKDFTGKDAVLGFDYINTIASDSTSAFVDLKNISVKEATNVFDIEKKAEYSFQAGSEGWTFITIPGSWQAPSGSAVNSSLRITGPGTAIEPRGCLGIWQSPAISIQVPTQTSSIGYLHKIVFTVGTDISDAAMVPSIGLAVNSGDLLAGNCQVSTMTQINSVGDASASPVLGKDRTYEVYFTMPAGATENSVTLLFFYLNADDSPSGYIDLKDVKIYKETRDVLP